MLVCGYNRYLQLDKTSTNKNSWGDPIIDQSFKFHADLSSLSSFSTNHFQTVWVTLDGKSLVRGYNRYGVISGSLPKETFSEDTELFLKDSEGQPCNITSVVCGYEYTLYLVSSESGNAYFKLVLCYDNQTPNPLFVNIGNRTPQALFGGYTTSGVIDSEGGIIVLSKSIFQSPKKRVEASFLQENDKPVKLACCYSFVIALGMSGRVYESEISSRIKFEIVKELSETTVVDVSGAHDFCFAVLKDGRVFGRGRNSDCKLGLPKETESVSTFTLIESLNKHKIVSVFTGSYHSIFRTSENKMIMCGSNKYGQLFIPFKNKDKNKNIVYPPEEVKKCQGFTFCVTGSSESSAFLDIEVPLNFSNKIITEGAVSKVQNDNKEAELRREIEELRKNLLKKDEEISELKKTIKSMNKEIDRKVKKRPIQIFGSDEMKNYEIKSEIGIDNLSVNYIITQETKLMMKVLKLNDVNIHSLKEFLQECEILNELDDEHIIKTYGIFLGDHEQPPAIICEYCESNLNEQIEKLTKEERIKIIIDICSTMEKVHSQKIIYGNLTPENILLDSNNQVKLSGFEYFKLMGNERIDMIPYSKMIYMPPELISDEEYYDEKIDVYAFGVVLFLILSNGEFPKVNIRNIMKGKKAPIPSNFTAFSTQLIQDCWSYESRNRPSFAEISDLLGKNEQNII